MRQRPMLLAVLGWIPLLTLATMASQAADYPAKPIRLIVPLPPGSLMDLHARLIAQKHRLGQPVVVDNRAGADGRIGSELIAKAPADGYTLGIATIGTLVVAPLIHTNTGYDPVRSFAPVSRMTTAPYLIVVHPAVTAGSLKELIDLARAKPGLLNHATANAFARLAGELFNSTAGIKTGNVPYQGPVAATTDLISGRVQLMVEAPGVFRQEIQLGRLHALAVADSRRYAHLPQVPTTAEAGLAGFEVRTWFGVTAPAATPARAIALWNSEINQILAMKDVTDSLATQGLEAAATTPQQFSDFARDERARWARVVKQAGLKFD